MVVVGGGSGGMVGRLWRAHTHTHTHTHPSTFLISHSHIFTSLVSPYLLSPHILISLHLSARRAAGGAAVAHLCDGFNRVCLDLLANLVLEVGEVRGGAVVDKDLDWLELQVAVHGDVDGAASHPSTELLRPSRAHNP